MKIDPQLLSVALNYCTKDIIRYITLALVLLFLGYCRFIAALPHRRVT